MIDKKKLAALEALVTNRGARSRFTDEQVVDAYLREGSFNKAAKALGLSMQSVAYRIAKIRRAARGAQ